MNQQKKKQTFKELQSKLAIVNNQTDTLISDIRVLEINKNKGERHSVLREHLCDVSRMRAKLLNEIRNYGKDSEPIHLSNFKM